MQENETLQNSNASGNATILSHFRELLSICALIACLLIIVTQDSRLALLRYSDEQRQEDRKRHTEYMTAEQNYHKAESEYRRAQDEKSNALLAALIVKLPTPPAPEVKRRPVRKGKPKPKPVSELYTTDRGGDYTGKL